MRRAILALVILLALPVLAAPADAQLPATPLDPLLQVADDTATKAREDVVGPELTREDIDISLDMAFRTVDFDTLNVIFGGGRFEATARISGRIDMRVIAASRVAAVVDGVVPGAQNVTALGMDPRTTFIPADAFRSALAGEALRAFQDEQELRLAEYITATIPNVTVLSTQFVWTNVSPEDSYQESTVVPNDPPRSLADVNDPTFPPITLQATVDVQYLERTNLLDILDKALAPKSESEQARKREVADAEAEYERSAFGLLGIRQVLDLQAFSGWNLRVRVTLPEGYTFEEASPDVTVGSDYRSANIVTLGREASGTVLNPVSLTLSNRFVVSTALLSGILLVGSILRFPILLGTNYWRRRMRS